MPPRFPVASQAYYDRTTKFPKYDDRRVKARSFFRRLKKL